MKCLLDNTDDINADYVVINNSNNNQYENVNVEHTICCLYHYTINSFILYSKLYTS